MSSLVKKIILNVWQIVGKRIGVPVHFVLGLSVILAPVLVRADVVADAAAPASQRPTVLEAGNGVPVVNIRTPSSAGVSRNAYSEFNVDQQGVILNNGRTDSSTQLGGWVQANPWLATGSARVILNEVNASDPSRLNGYVEVAGSRAQVVIANPAGISCEGCGFINANRATLTTGTPILNNGRLEGYEVSQGRVTVGGAGLDNSGGYTDLIAHAVEVNAGIWSQGVAVAGGGGTVNADVTQVTDNGGTGPEVAIDVAHLGGMYANSIRMIGNNAGVGVRNAGQIGVGAGEVVLTADGRIENVGVINGGDTQLNAQQLDNSADGRLYGDRVSIAADSISNIGNGETAPVIAARQELNVGATTIDNREHGLIYSDGDMAVGGGLDENRNAIGRAEMLNNASASIEALGDMHLGVQQINNTNEHLELGTATLSSERIVEYSGASSQNRYSADEVRWAYQDRATYLVTPEDTWHNWNRYTYTRTVTQTEVVNSDPGRIVAGGDLRIDSDILNNDNSHVLAGGQLELGQTQLNNITAPGNTTTTDIGVVRYYRRGTYCANRVAGVCENRDYNTRSRNASYRPNPRVVDHDLGTAMANGNVQVTTELPDSSLYTVNPAAPRGYLVETDPRFTEYRQWISSDYMLQQLAVDPALTQMRLGDGFYEQQLVREQMAQLTGRRFLGSYTDDEEQYIALMDAGVTFAQAHDIRPGIALTAEQMAQLTSDIVWLVEEQRTLPDGTTANVLVPRLYVMVRENGISGSGALVAADTLRIDMQQDFENQGTVAGHSLLAITADNIDNLRGTLQGADVQLNARNDISNVGGSIRAGDNLSIQAGNDINVVSTTRSTRNEQGTRTYIDRVAGLYVNSGSLLANAGHNINLTGAAIVNDTLVLDADRLGNTVLTAGNNFILNSVQEKETQKIIWADGAYEQSAATRQIGSQIQTRGDIALIAGNDLTATAARINSEQGSVQIDAARDIAVSAGVNEWHADTRSAHHRGREDRIQHETATLTAGNGVMINAGRDLALTGTDMAALGDVALAARGDTAISAVVDTVYRFDKESYKGDMGRSLKFTDETLASTVRGGTLASGGDLLVNAHKNADGDIISQQSGNLTLTGAQLKSGNDIALAADGDINISAIQYNTLEFHQTQKSGTGGLSKSDEGSASVESRLQNAVLTSGGNTHVISGNNLSLIAADITANGDINLEAIDQLLIAAGQVLTSNEQWKNESDTFSGGNLYEMREHRAGETISGAQASTLTAGGSVTARAGSGRVIGSDIHGEQKVDLQADAGDFTAEAAQITRSSYTYDKEITVGLGDSVIKGAVNPALLVQVNDGRATVHIADAHYAESDTRNTSTHMRGANISSGGDVNIAASAGNVNVIGSTLTADTDDDGNGDVNLSAAQNVNIVEATDTASSQSRTTTGDAEVSLVIQNQAVEVAKAYERLEEAKEQLEEAKRQYKDYERNLDQLKQSLHQLEQDLADKKPGVNYDDIVELRALVEDVKDDKEWHVAGIALATLNLTSATTALMQQTAALGPSATTWGFNAGLQLDIDATKTSSEYQSTTAVASSLSGQNIRINTGNGNTQNTTTNIQGSQLLASNNITINTGDLNVTASKNTATSSSETERGHITAQMTVYGAAGGASVNASFDRSRNSTKETTYNNSVLTADSIDLTTSGDTTLRGATVRAESELNTDIGGNLIVESVQDRSSSRNTSAGISGGYSLGGDGALSGVNAGANSANGMSNTRQTVLTSLTSGGSANINVQNHTQITGALVATTDENGHDLNQMNFSTGTLGFTDLRDRNISSQTSAGLSSNVGIGPANPDPTQPTTAQTSNGNELHPGTSNLTYSNSQQNRASNTLATLGHGTITVGGTVLEQNGALTEAGAAEDSPLVGINRDTTDTDKELWNSDYRQELDVTIDNRLLDPSRWDEIGQDYVNAAEASKDIFNAAVDKVQQYSRELAAMGNDLPEHLRNQLGQTGEHFVDALIRAGYSDEQINDLLSRQNVLNGLASQESVSGYSVEQLSSMVQDGHYEAAITPVILSASGYVDTAMLEPIVITENRLDPNALQVAVAGLGQIQQEIDLLMDVDPALAQGLELGIQLATGGPVKAALAQVVNYGIEHTIGERLQQGIEAVHHYAGSRIQNTNVDEFGQVIVEESNAASGNNLPLGLSYTDTVDGIRLGAGIVGIGIGSAVASRGSSDRGGSGSGSSLGGSGPDKNSLSGSEGISNSQSSVKDETGGTLIRHDNFGGHAVQKHVGKTDQELLDRFITEPHIKGSSTFTDLPTADKAVGQAVNVNKNKIDEWLSGGGRRLELNHETNFDVGRVIANGATASQSSRKVFVLIERDPLMPNGYRIHTAYPE